MADRHVPASATIAPDADQRAARTEPFRNLMMRPPKRWLSALVVLGSVSAVSALRAVLDEVLLDRLPFLLFVVAVAVSDFVGGFLAGCAALALSLVLGTYLFAAPRLELGIEGVDRLISAFTFALVGCSVLALLETERRRRREADQANERLQREHARSFALERELDAARQLESLGRLAGGVAHDFNNLLTVILGTAELLQRAGTSNEDLRTIVVAAERGADLTRQLLQFARREPVRLTPLSANDLVMEALQLSRRLIPADISFETSLVDEPWLFQGAPSLMQQVLVNLITNARDAMPSGGSVTIETSNVTLDARFSERHPEVTPGEYVRIRVADSGVGMDDEVRRRIFEPFFTTKEQGHGTGLGLAVCYGIVKQLGGHIFVRSEPTGGTVFDVFLPRALREVGGGASVSPSGASSSRSLCVLLVDDDAMIGKVAANMLRSRGHSVVAADNPAHALQLARDYPGAIDVLVTDVVMPWMNGRKLAEHVACVRPGIPVVYISGYSENVILNRGVIKPGVVLVQKPFTAEQLERAVQEVCAHTRAVG